MLFSEVIGQEALRQQLAGAAQRGRVSHAQLLVGREGSGGMALALAYAQYLMCEAPTEADACGQCSACAKMHKLAHPDLHFAFPVNVPTGDRRKDPVSDMFIAEWRTALLSNPYLTEQEWLQGLQLSNKQGNISAHEAEAILRKLTLKAFEGRYKILLMWLPERMNATAANKLLKLIEEPPAQTLFLLVAENTGLLLKTILSRTQLVHVPPVGEEALAAMLARELRLPQAEARTAAHLANGSVPEARRVATLSSEQGEHFAPFVQLMRLSYSKKPDEMVQRISWADEQAGAGRELQKSFLAYALRMVRENFAMNRQAHEAVYLAGEEAAWSAKFSPFIHPGNVGAIYHELNLALQHLAQNGNPKIIFTDLILKLSRLIRG
ncbi:MAG: DNA polymerase III subunit delta [Prevotellaceae bacterium]|jgi:DNA polymerase-3 subunit delta'|nr:DNA polymerase III subunit delta [Prevotellaceae bacterium]